MGISKYNISYNPSRLVELSSKQSVKAGQSELRLCSPDVILDLINKDNANNHSLLSNIEDLLSRLESVKSENHVYKISLMMFTKSTSKSVQKRAYTILLKSLDRLLNTQFGLELVLEILVLGSEFGEMQLQVLARILTTLEIQILEMPGIRLKGEIVNFVWKSLDKFSSNDIYLEHLLQVAKLQVKMVAYGSLVKSLNREMKYPNVLRWAFKYA
jgi:hypothetical protein